ncbi:MAG: peptidoglycan DD-metalloendopeptidase family protein [Rhodobacteraceae bacterium]|nr:peptidoglycan DD-metalloendopeptidase family protein [Paracoccaceae bacterium]
MERAFPEQRLFLRSEGETRYLRFTPKIQLIALTGCALVLGWTIVATAILLMDSVGVGNVRDQVARDQLLYEKRLATMSQSRDARAEEARLAQERFNTALQQVSNMQSELLASEDRRRELETGIKVVQTALRRTILERDAAMAEGEMLSGLLTDDGTARTGTTSRTREIATTVDMLADLLDVTAAERDIESVESQAARSELEELLRKKRIENDRTDRIFAQLEEALTVSVQPLEKMFSSAGVNTDNLIEQVRRDYSGQGGPLAPLTFSTKGEAPDEMTLRANEILSSLDQINLYRLAVEKTPFMIPLTQSFRYTSGFGPRWGRMHSGTDFAGAHGSPIHATADGVVTHAGRAGAYGNLVKIQHAYSYETRYAHASKIYVKVGQRVSRGDRIAAMGNTGRSTGTHLHYEIRIGGKAINPMRYIKAARDVF